MRGNKRGNRKVNTQKKQQRKQVRSDNLKERKQYGLRGFPRTKGNRRGNKERGNK